MEAGVARGRHITFARDAGDAVSARRPTPPARGEPRRRADVAAMAIAPSPIAHEPMSGAIVIDPRPRPNDTSATARLRCRVNQRVVVAAIGA